MTPGSRRAKLNCFLRAFARAGCAKGSLGLAATGAWYALSPDEQAQALVLLRRALYLLVACPLLRPLAAVLAAD